MVPDISGNPLNKLKQNAKKAKNAGEGMIKKAENEVARTANQVTNAATSMTNQAEKAFASTTSKAEKAVTSMTSKAEKAVTSAESLAKNAVNQKVSNIGIIASTPNINKLSVGKQFPNVPQNLTQNLPKDFTQNLTQNLTKKLPIDPKLGDQLKKLEDLKNLKDLKPTIKQALSLVKKNTQPKYAVETSNLIYSLGNGNPTKILFIMGIFLFGIVFIMADLISFNNIASNIVSYFILNLAFLTTLPKIIISVIGLLPGDFTSMTKLNEFIYFVSIYIISFFLNYKLYKLYITQKCAEEKIECNYMEEVVGQPFNYAFISTTITFALMIIIKYIVKIVEKTTPPLSPLNKGASAFLRLYDYSELFKYGLIYNLIGTVIHTIVLYSIKSKMTVQPASY